MSKVISIEDVAVKPLLESPHLEVKDFIEAHKSVVPFDAPIVYRGEASLEKATLDERDLVKKSRSEYVAAFNKSLVKTARSTLDMCRVVYEANHCHDPWEFNDFCKAIGYTSKKSSTIRKYIVIGKVYPRLIKHAERLPASWTSIYLLTQIPAQVFDELAEQNRTLADLKGRELADLIMRTRGDKSVGDMLSFDKQSGGFAFATLIFTKRPDDTDWRAMQKALEELRARLPIAFRVNQYAQKLWNMRKDQRYEQSKSQYEAVEFKPEVWDFGREAQAALPRKEPVPTKA
jgi:hypothetical protein